MAEQLCALAVVGSRTAAERVQTQRCPGKRGRVTIHVRKLTDAAVRGAGRVWVAGSVSGSGQRKDQLHAAGRTGGE